MTLAASRSSARQQIDFGSGASLEATVAEPVAMYVVHEPSYTFALLRLPAKRAWRAQDTLCSWVCCTALDKLDGRQYIGRGGAVVVVLVATAKRANPRPTADVELPTVAQLDEVAATQTWRKPKTHNYRGHGY